MKNFPHFKRNFHIICLLCIILLGAVLRLYRIRDYLGFLGDEGRDALVVKRMLVDHKFTLLGPITSVGLMHLGPMYYYFMMPFLALTLLDPVGPAIMVALFSLATIFLIWKICTDYFDPKSGLIASLLYACSPLVIIFSHSSWNPNILPFWSLLIIYSLLKLNVTKENVGWLFVTGLAFGIAIQLHYVALVFLPIILGVILLNRKKIGIKPLNLLLIGFMISFSPFIFFELRNKFVNTLSIIKFVSRTGNAKTFEFFNIIERFWDLSVRLFWRLVVIENAEIAIIFMFLVFGLCSYIYWKSNKTAEKRIILHIFIIWFVLGIGLLSLYTGNIFDYYLMFIFPLPFLLTGISLSYLSKKWFGKLVTVFILSCLIYFELKNTPISKPPNRLATQTQEIAKFVLVQANNLPYNFALMANMNSDHAYRYFLEIEGHPPVILKNPIEDPERVSVTEQLLVVCEEKVCQPLGHPLWEIAGFGRAEIVQESTVGLFKVFKLVHYKVK